MSLTKSKLAKSMPDEKKAQFLIETILETIKSTLEKGEEVKIAGFGKWTVRKKRSRKGRNPHTGETMEITARRVVVFQSSKKLQINNVRK